MFLPNTHPKWVNLQKYYEVRSEFDPEVTKQKYLKQAEWCHVGSIFAGKYQEENENVIWRCLQAGLKTMQYTMNKQQASKYYWLISAQNDSNILLRTARMVDH